MSERLRGREMEKQYEKEGDLYLYVCLVEGNCQRKKATEAVSVIGFLDVST